MTCGEFNLAVVTRVVSVAIHSLFVVTLGANATINPTVVTLGFDPRAHTVMLRQSQLSTFAPITEWFHGSALRLSEDDGWGI